MTVEVKAHETSTSMVKAALAELDAGTDIALKVRVSCSSACELRGKIVKIITQDAVVKEIELVTFDGTVNETDEFVVKAPIKPGVYTWTAVFPAQETEGILHEESSVPFSFIVKPHATSITVWDVPSPIALGDEFKLKVRVSCSSACDLRGKMVKIIAQDAVMAKEIELVSFDGTVNETGEFVVKAPIKPGVYTWTAVFPTKESVIHEESSVPFSFIVKPHATSITVWDVPSPIAFGDEFELKVRVKCSSACDLQGKIVKIIAQDAVVAKEIELVTFDGTVNETDEFVVKAPIKPGVYTWTAVFPAQETEGILHEESSVPFSFIVKGHATSIAVWDVPSPIAFGDEFKLKVGVGCSADCKLTGSKIEIYDLKGVKVATGTLGDVPWSGATALSCAEVELEAPSIEGRYRWTVKFPKQELEPPHEEASCTFAFAAARQPEHVVTIEVIDKDTKTPIKNAHVLFLPRKYRGYTYSSRTDDGGVARVSVPKGEYQANVKGDGKEAFLGIVKVASDITIKAELEVVEREWWED